MSEAHWMERADRVGGNARILGEDDYGVLMVPRLGKRGQWKRTLDLRKPWHWLPYLRSRLTSRIAFLELSS